MRVMHFCRLYSEGRLAVLRAANPVVLEAFNSFRSYRK